MLYWYLGLCLLGCAPPPLGRVLHLYLKVSRNQPQTDYSGGTSKYATYSREQLTTVSDILEGCVLVVYSNIVLKTALVLNLVLSFLCHNIIFWQVSD